MIIIPLLHHFSSPIETHRTASSSLQDKCIVLNKRWGKETLDGCDPRTAAERNNGKEIRVYKNNST